MVMLILLLSAFIVAVVLTGISRRYAIASFLLDIPNNRSSHHIPTPRGGGLAIVGVFLASVPVFWQLDIFTLHEMLALLGAGALVATIGFFDDRQSVSVRLRLSAHLFASAWALFWLGVPPIPLFDSPLGSGIASLLGIFYLIWLLNLYNFMDGIDGLAGIEAITVCFGGGILYWLMNDSNGSYWPLFLLAMAVAGFLCWNFPPAKIFMGDGGSGFLGLVLGIFSLQAAWFSPQFFWSWLILLGVFIVDATWTLLHRLYQGEKIYQAHRSHAYQRAARHYGAHKPVSLTVAIINVFWLLPMALWVGMGGTNGLLGMLLSYVPLFILALIFKAGAKEEAR